MLLRAFTGLALVLMSTTASAAELTREAIEEATFTEGDGLPSEDEQSPLGFKLQVLLDRADISPGILDGYYGMNVPFPGHGQTSGLITASLLIVVISGALYLLFKRKDWL